METHGLPSKSFTSEQLLLIWLSLLGGPYRFPGFYGNQHNYSRSNMMPKLIPKQARKWIEELLFWFQVLRQHFMFLSCCIHFLSFSFHVPFICIHFPSCSFHIPFTFIPRCIHVPSSSFRHLHTYSFYFALMSFHFLSKVIEVALSLGQGTKCNKWLSLSHRYGYRSINNPSNI